MASNPSTKAVVESALEENDRDFILAFRSAMNEKLKTKLVERVKLEEVYFRDSEHPDVKELIRRGYRLKKSAAGRDVLEGPDGSHKVISRKNGKVHVVSEANEWTADNVHEHPDLKKIVDEYERSEGKGGWPHSHEMSDDVRTARWGRSMNDRYDRLKQKILAGEDPLQEDSHEDTFQRTSDNVRNQLIQYQDDEGNQTQGRVIGHSRPNGNMAYHVQNAHTGKMHVVTGTGINRMAVVREGVSRSGDQLCPSRDFGNHIYEKGSCSLCGAIPHKSDFRMPEDYETVAGETRNTVLPSNKGGGKPLSFAKPPKRRDMVPNSQEKVTEGTYNALWDTSGEQVGYYGPHPTKTGLFHWGHTQSDVTGSAPTLQAAKASLKKTHFDYVGKEVPLREEVIRLNELGNTPEGKAKLHDYIEWAKTQGFDSQLSAAADKDRAARHKDEAAKATNDDDKDFHEKRVAAFEKSAAMTDRAVANRKKGVSNAAKRLLKAGGKR